MQENTDKSGAAVQTEYACWLVRNAVMQTWDTDEELDKWNAGEVSFKDPKIVAAFDKIKDVYGKVLELALRFKIVPLAISIVLLVLCVMQSMRTGIVMMDDMDSNQIAVSMTLDDNVKKENAYKTTDEVMGILTGVDGIKKVSALDGNASVTSSMQIITQASALISSQKII